MIGWLAGLEFHDGAWRLEHFEPICSLDAARFRLPLVQAAARLSRLCEGATTLIDAPPNLEPGDWLEETRLRDRRDRRLRRVAGVTAAVAAVLAAGLLLLSLGSL